MTNQIVEKAVEKLHSIYCRTREDEKTVIQSACEEAVKPWRDAAEAEQRLRESRTTQPQDAPCRHEWYQGKCVHCEITSTEFRASQDDTKKRAAMTHEALKDDFPQDDTKLLEDIKWLVEALHEARDVIIRAAMKARKPNV